MFRIRTVVVALFVLGLFAVSAAAQGPAGVDYISAADLKARVERGDNLVLLDARSRGAYDSSDVEIKGAVRIPTDELEQRAFELPFGAEIATFCT